MEDRKFFRKTAKDCKKRYKQLLSLYSKQTALICLYEDSINKLIDERVKKQLMDVPVEALNFNSARIRTSSLRAAGYESVGQLVGKSSYSLGRIYGIGEVSIERIKQNASAIFKLYRKKIKIKSNVRSHSDKDRDVVTIVAKYANACEKEQDCCGFIKRYQAECLNPIKKILNSTNAIIWLISSKNKRQKSLNYAKEIVGEKCNPFLDETNEVVKKSSDNEIYTLYKDNIDKLNKCVSKKWPCIEFVDETVERMVVRPESKSFYNVTGICKITAQPRGGFININSFEKVIINDGVELSDEQIGAGTIGTTVDYLTRVQLGCCDKRKAFEISLLGASLMKDEKVAEQLLSKVTDLSDESIRNAALLVGYDATFRAGYPFHADPNYKIDSDTLNNIRVLVNRSTEFFKKNGTNIESGLLFQGGYTDRVSSGDADFMVDGTIWDLKTSKTEPDKNQTLQIMIYYLLAKHSKQEKYKNLNSIGIYNPRLNISYKLDVDKIDKSIIETIEKDVIGY